jgi:glycosyltransferase involved in cell wall biosynthesis
MSSRRVCLLPRLSGVGGMVSFQHKLAAGLVRRGVEVSYDLADTPYQAILVIGGTRQIPALWLAKRKGIPIVQRLDGMNWLHRLPGGKGILRGGLRHSLRAEYGNLVLAWLRARLANRVVYQSEFVRGWWERVHGATPVPNRVIYNGVDLNVYTPHGPGQIPDDHVRLLMVEGSLMGGYEQGLQAAVLLAERLAEKRGRVFDVELMIVGRVSSELQSYWDRRVHREGVQLTWAGVVGSEQIPQLDRSAHLLYSADVNAACPNSVIEALACGLPVISFDTGALPELVTGEAGCIVPYGGNPWRLDPPDVDALAEAAGEILNEPERFRQAARLRAEAVFGLETMVEAYLDVLLKG